MGPLRRRGRGRGAADRVGFDGHGRDDGARRGGPVVERRARGGRRPRPRRRRRRRSTSPALCQRAEHRASGVPCGIMDQLASVAGVDGARAPASTATPSTSRPVPLPDDVEVVVVALGPAATLAGSAYAERARAVRAAAERIIGPLRAATLDDVDRIADPVVPAPRPPRGHRERAGARVRRRARGRRPRPLPAR